MSTQPSLAQTLKHPSAFLPIVMSLLAIAVILTHLVRFGPAPQPDEGTSAHLWQLLMALQMPIIAFFAIRWLPRAPRSSLFVLFIQLTSGLGALAPVYFLHW